MLRQVPALYIKIECKSRTLSRQSLVPAHGVCVEVTFFNATYQRVIEYMLFIICCIFEPHHSTQGVQGCCFLLLPEGRVDDTVIGAVSRGPSC